MNFTGERVSEEYSDAVKEILHPTEDVGMFRVDLPRKESFMPVSEPGRTRRLSGKFLLRSESKVFEPPDSPPV